MDKDKNNIDNNFTNGTTGEIPEKLSPLQKVWFYFYPKKIKNYGINIRCKIYISKEIRACP